MYQAASCSRLRGRMYQAASCLRLRAHARGGVPPLRRPELNNPGALRTEPPLRMSTYALNDELRGAKQGAMPY